MIKEYFVLALKSLRHRGLRSWLTLLGIIIGISAVVALISLGQGLETAITGQFATIAPDRLVVTNSEAGFGPPGSTVVNKLNSHDIKIIESVPGVKDTIPRLIRNAKVEYNKESRFEFVGSLPKSKEGIDFLYNTFQLEAQSGKLLDRDERGSVFLGSDFANEDRYGKEIRPGSKITIQEESFEVSGILKPLSSFQFNGAIFMNEDDLKKILNIGDEFDMIVVQIDDSDRAEEISKEISRKMRKDRDLKEGEEDFSVQTPLNSIGAINTILNIINIVVSGIAAISLLIGVIGITNTMFTSVLERTKEIGVMKAIGAQNNDVLKIFVIESSFLGLIGGIIGAILGLCLAFGASKIVSLSMKVDILSVSISWPLFFGAILLSLILGLVAGIIPAFQASKLNPTEALRK